MKKIAALILGLLLLVPAVTACGNVNNPADTETEAPSVATTEAVAETVDNTHDVNGYLKDDLPEGLNFGVTITTLMWDDYTMLEFYVEETSGNNIESAIFKRNNTVESRLGVTLKYSETNGAGGKENAYIKVAENDLNSGDATFDIYGVYSKVPPLMSLKGYLTDLLSTKYFDIEKPWWPKALTEECEINGKLFYASGDISTNLLWMMTGNFYNRALYASYTGDENYSKTPEQYVAANEWTMEKLFNMTKDSYIDTDNDNTKSAGDTYGMILYNVNIDAFQTSAGIISVEKNADGQLQLSADYTGQRAADACQLVGDYLKATGVYYKDSTSIRNIFYEERGTFIIDRCFIVAGKDNASAHDKIEFSFGIVPVPKFNSEQETFCTSVGHPFSMYAISYASKNIDAASATLECLASESYRTVTPEVFESTMKVRYADGAEVAEMYDIIRDNVRFDLGRLYSAGPIGSSLANQFRTSSINNPAGFLTAVKSASKVANKGLATIEESFK